MNRLTIIVGRLNKSVGQTEYFFKVPQIGRFISLVGMISRHVESPLKLSEPILWMLLFTTPIRIKRDFKQLFIILI